MKKKVAFLIVGILIVVIMLLLYINDTLMDNRNEFFYNLYSYKNTIFPIISPNIHTILFHIYIISINTYFSIEKSHDFKSRDFKYIYINNLFSYQME